MDKEAKIMSRVSEHFDYVKNLGYEPIYIGLYGSQNYELDTLHSDVDTKVIVLPSLEDIVLNKKPLSVELELPNKEHCDIKDIRLMIKSFKKQNINFLEILFTKYFRVELWAATELNELCSLREEIAHYNEIAAVKCMSGMATQKYCALQRDFPSKREVLERFGYDPKQLHHIIRLREFLERYILGETFEDCLISKHKEYLIRIKNGEVSNENAMLLAQTELNKILDIENDFLKKEYSIEKEIEKTDKIEEKLNNILIRLFKKKLNIL